MDIESDKKSDEMPEFFQEKKEKPVKKEPSKITFGLKKNKQELNLPKRLKPV